MPDYTVAPLPRSLGSTPLSGTGISPSDIYPTSAFPSPRDLERTLKIVEQLSPNEAVGSKGLGEKKLLETGTVDVRSRAAGDSDGIRGSGASLGGAQREQLHSPPPTRWSGQSMSGV